MPIKRLGHIPDVTPDDDDHIARLVWERHGTKTWPDYCEITKHLDAVQDQGSTGSCVGNALSTQILLTMRAAYREEGFARPSRKLIYDVARLMRDGALEDTGSSPRMAFAGLQKYGLVPESKWPLTAENINVSPDWAMFREASDTFLTGYYRIPSGGAAAEFARAAISKGFAVAFAMDVTQGFMDWPGTDTPYDARMDQGVIEGSHMMCLTAYRPGELRVTNSWGPYWSDSGFCWLTDECFNSEKCRDRVVITGVKQ